MFIIAAKQLVCNKQVWHKCLVQRTYVTIVNFEMNAVNVCTIRLHCQITF